MVVEVPISLSGVVAPLVSFVVRMMPKCVRKYRPFSFVGLWADARALRQHFDYTDAKYDRHIHLIAIEGASSILGRLDIPHPEKKMGPNVWRAFLAPIVSAAEQGDIKRARAVMSNEEWGFMWARPNFGTTSTPPPSIQPTASVPDDIEAVKLNPGNGRRVVRLIMRASTEIDVDDLYGDFRSASHKTAESEVFAAYSLKKDRLLNGDQDEDWWWDFYGEAEKLEDPDEVIRALYRLEKEYPDEG